jgi:hypothetical protein
MPETSDVFKQQLREAFDFTVSYTNQDGVEVLTGSFRGFPSNVRLAR